jgi:hypothetical protein
MALFTYDPAQVALVCGAFTIGGFAEDTFIEAERDEDAFTLLIGADGDGTRAKSNNKSGTVTVTLMNSSASNDVFSDFALQDEQSGTGTFPLLLKDASGRTLITAENMWVQKFASVEMSRENSTREWVLRTENLVVFVGGN